MMGKNGLYLRILLIVLFSLFTRTSFSSAEPPPQTGGAAVDKAPDSEMKQLVSEGLALLNKGSYEEATQSFSKALKFDPSRSWLHFLNGLTYHLRASAGNGALYELAEQGYQLAVKFDGSNWMGNYYLGLLYLDQRKFDQAQKKIAETLLVNADNAEVVYSMLYASYYAGDPHTAEAMLMRLKILNPDDKRIARLSPLLSAALNKPDQAKADLDHYASVAKNEPDFQLLASRVSDWKRFYNSHQPAQQAEAERLKAFEASLAAKEAAASGAAQSAVPAAITPVAPSTVLPPPPAISQSSVPAATLQPEAPIEEEMVSVDVVMISTEESVSTNSGVNLLNGLNLQYKGGYTFTKNSGATNSVNGGTSVSNLLHDISIPSVTYSLNIFNSHNERNEILARPTLTALNGLQSVFFSGSHLEAATVSTSTIPGDSVKISADIGVKLTIQPQLISRKRLKLGVTAERTFLKTPSKAVEYTSKVEMSKISVQANVVMEFGETLVLSGLSEKETQKSRDGVPFLQNIPLIQYLFSNKAQLDFHRSVLILITPRPRLNVYAKTAEEKDAANSGMINELQARYSDWFKPYPNTSSVFHHLQSNSLYREFRTGDVSMERWNTQQTLKDALRQAAEFIYY